ncbi:unnamed protein product [Rotaria magnacalcarata]|uniref:Uncharacterized protein n=1 Tax=Rotaria magnacalcarata TaxID=392030 RepID=A0A815IP25_9BILA|nr:unnamed protein product [Rotaria magnacalcarata]CAF1507350.1 unnamed protein product [Rotaria magnacalcarata]CAF3843311.1 unnamed protein product [Rotaria magnacalcarata]CAF3862907.1 unnamed protein product [Rotaria magnacalcarata]
MKFRLQHDKSNFKVIDNDVSTLKSKCWKSFGFTARKNKTNDYQRILRFVSCRQCLKTYACTSTTGAKHENFDVKNIVRGADTISNHTYSLSDEYRSKLKQILSEPFENEAVCVSPDMWSDRHKQMSYLGIFCTSVDVEYNYNAVDLCCRPYYEDDHSGDNILLAIQKALEVFDLNDLSQLHFVTDRGPNLGKALKHYRSIYCYGHRLNNLLKRSFFQLNMKKRKNETAVTQVSVLQSNLTNKDSDFSTSASEDDIESVLPIIKNKKKTTDTAAATSVSSDPRKVQLAGMNPAVHRDIETIINCKKLVKYVKKAGLNKDIQQADGIALQQFTVVRWLSMIELLKSILRSYKPTKRVLTIKKQQAKLVVIDENIVEGLANLLKPFKTTLKLIQTGNSPSLCMVLICTLSLRDMLSSFKNLISSTPSLDKYNPNQTNVSDDDAEDMIESEGLCILRERTLQLLNLMFELDVRHFVATMLHPKYRQLRDCSKEERNQASQYTRDQMSKIIRHDRSNDSCIIEPKTKRQKSEKSILEAYEDTSGNESDSFQKQDDDSGSDVDDHKSTKSDELAIQY